jgi:hypothetical protein
MTKNDRELVGPATPPITARTANVSDDSKLDRLTGLVQALKGAPLMLHSKVEPGVSLTNVNVTDRANTVLPLDGPDVTVTLGGGRTFQLVLSLSVPLAFVAQTVKLCDPGARPEADHGLEHGDGDAPSRLQVTVADGSETVNATVAFGLHPELGGPETMVTVGVCGCTVQLWVSEPEPPVFVAVMTTVCGPDPRPLSDHGDEHGVPGAPSRLQVTVADGSETVNGTDADVDDDEPGPPFIVTTGATGSTVHV